jgi:Uma2 family endonuclease
VTDILETSVAPERPVPPAPMSFEQFLAWCDEDTHAEWVDGEIVLMSPSSVRDLRLIQFLFDLVRAFVVPHQLGEVFIHGLIMRLASYPSGREPDLLFLAAEHADRLKDTYLDGPADLAVEIVSPDSVERDRGEKFAEYEAGGVPEYWQVDPLRQEASFYQLGSDGRYRPGPTDEDGFYHSLVLPGFRLRPDWLWQRPLPPIADMVHQIEA